MKSISDYINNHQNNHRNVAVVWGSGTSVNSLNPAEYSSFLNIAVNASIMLFPSWYEGSAKNRISISLDAEAIYWDWFPTADTKCHRFLRKCSHPLDRYGNVSTNPNKWVFPKEMYEADNTYCFNRRQRNIDLINFENIDSCPYVNTAPLSIDIAVKTGAKLIALAGMEQIPNENNITHFYQTWPKDKQPKFGDQGKFPRGSPFNLPYKRHMRRWRRYTDTIYNFELEAIKRGIRIIRLSEKSALSFIPYMSEKEFLSKAKKIQ